MPGQDSALELSLNDRGFSLLVRRQLLNGQLLFFTRNIERLYMNLQQRFGAGAGTAGTYMSLLEMTEELKAFQAEEPTEFATMWPPEIALNVDDKGPAKEHFDAAVEQGKQNAKRMELAETRRATRWVMYQLEGGALPSWRGQAAALKTRRRGTPAHPWTRRAQAGAARVTDGRRPTTTGGNWGLSRRTWTSRKSPPRR